MADTLYKKVGRRYVPVREYDEEYRNSDAEGAYLKIVRPGRTSSRSIIEPEFAPLIAAGMIAEDAIVSSIMHASELQPQPAPLTAEQKEAWENLKQTFDGAMQGLVRESAAAIKSAALDTMIAEQEKLMKHPSVKKAYDNFLLVCQLTKEKENV